MPDFWVFLHELIKLVSRNECSDAVFATISNGTPEICTVRESGVHSFPHVNSKRLANTMKLKYYFPVLIGHKCACL
jgi:hypothetical protein